jgi:dTDP-4-amino-4,6-dideoxygalactose transaminase
MARDITYRVPFNRPQSAGAELDYIERAVVHGHLAGEGLFARRCAAWLQAELGSERVFMTSSCSAALEMAARLAGIGPGDEVIMPSFTFVSTATAVIRAGGVPVFAEIDPDTLNLDPAAAAAALGPRTRAICPIHYGGVAADMEALGDLALRAGLRVIEDAAHAVGASWRGRPLGSLGDLAGLSFHETKNVQCGEGGALLVNDSSLGAGAELMHNRGTNRGAFERGEVDHYTWVGEGSNYLMGELNAAFLWAQLEQAEALTGTRRLIWQAYYESFEDLEARGVARRPVVPAGCVHNAHVFYLLLGDRAERDALIATLARRGVQAVFHYVPLHSSPAGRRLGRAAGDLALTENLAGRIVRLPLWAGLTPDQVGHVIGAVNGALQPRRRLAVT